ncbi:hypothetical protein V5O48_015846 [Marasmius crinis-equi]|uniref:Uncharacterized protein n=1 Tax=Marasmius crinis-equi TaxID=585013 RepID=A0ABR3ETP3_9AGAR
MGGSIKTYSPPLLPPVTAISSPPPVLTHVDLVEVTDEYPTCNQTLAFLASLFHGCCLTSVKLDWDTLNMVHAYAVKMGLPSIFPPTLTSVALVADPDSRIGTDDYQYHWKPIGINDVTRLYSLMKDIQANIKHLAICTRNQDLDYDVDTIPDFPSLTSFTGCISHIRDLTSACRHNLITELSLHECAFGSSNGLDFLGAMAGTFPCLTRFEFKYNGFLWATEVSEDEQNGPIAEC